MTNPHLTKLAALAVAVLAVASARTANLVTNGDFSSNAASFGTFPGYTGAAGNPAAIDAWTKVLLTGSGAVNVGVNGSGVGFASPSPEPFAPASTAGIANFGFVQRSTTRTGGLAQTISLQPNTKYKISWDAANRAGAGNLNAMGRVQVGDSSNVFFSSGDTTWGSSSFSSFSGTFRTGSSFSGATSVQLLNVTPASEGNDKTVSYSNVVLEPTTAVVLPTVANANFESFAGAFVNSPGYVAPTTAGNPTEISSWPGTANRGINPGSGAGTAFRDNGNNTSNVAFLQGPASISQSIAGWEVGEEYRVAFQYNARNAGTDPGLSATIGSASVTDATVAPVGNGRSYYAGNLVFTATNSVNTLSFANTNNTGDDTLLIDNVRVFRNGPAIADNGFENPVQPGTSGTSGFKQANGGGGGTLAGSAWTITGTAGITRNLSAFQNGIPTPEGDQHGLIQASGTFSQMVSGFEVGAEYSLSLLAMARQGQAFGNDLEVLLDAGLASEIVLLDIPEVTASSFTEFESPAFLADKGMYELTIRATRDGGNLSGDRTTFIDNVWFNQLTDAIVPEPASIALWSFLGLALAGLGYFRTRRRR